MAALNPWSYAERSNTEHAHQVALFMWANAAYKFGVELANNKDLYSVPGFVQAKRRSVPLGEQWCFPELRLKWLHAVHNQGHGDAIRGNQAKAEGVRAGVYDVFLPVPMYRPYRGSQYYEGWHHGLYIELKRPKSDRGAAGRVSDDQLAFKRDMEAMHYFCAEAFGWLEARDALTRYLEISA